MAVDDQARISIVSWAYRDPANGQVVMRAVPFDQGQDPRAVESDPAMLAKFSEPDGTFGKLPLGPKQLAIGDTKRIAKWVVTERDRLAASESTANPPTQPPTQPPEWRAPYYLLTAPNLPPNEFGRLAEQLRRMRLLAHNFKHDGHQFRVGLRGCEGLPPASGGGLDLEGSLVRDTQIAQFVIDPRNGSALKPTSVRLELGKELGLDAGTEDSEQQALAPWKGKKTDPRYDLIPWPVIRPYAELDAGLTLLLDEAQQQTLDDPASEILGLLRHVRRETSLMRVLYRMERQGIGYDVIASLTEAVKVRKLAAEVAASLPFKPTYPGARKYFFGSETEGGLGHLPYTDKMTKPSKTHPQGQPQVDEEAVARLVAEGVPNALEFQRHAELESANSKWYVAWAELTGKDGRLRTNFRQNSVVSGRLAVERAQLQAIPQPGKIPGGLRNVRGLFVAKPGHVLMEIDVAQAEPRIAVAVTRCRPMLDRFLAGEDSHGATTKLVFGIDESDPRWHELRQVAKRLGLAIIYGVGADTFRKNLLTFTGIDYPRDLVRGWIDDWRAAFPEMVKAYRDFERKAIRDGYVRLSNGRISYLSPFEPTYKALNRRIQGDQAEVVKDSMVEIDRRYPETLVLMVHDSVVVEVPIERSDQICQHVKRIIVGRFERMFERPWERGGAPVRVPFDAEIKSFNLTE